MAHAESGSRSQFINLSGNKSGSGKQGGFSGAKKGSGSNAAGQVRRSFVDEDSNHQQQNGIRTMQNNYISFEPKPISGDVKGSNSSVNLSDAQKIKRG